MRDDEHLESDRMPLIRPEQKRTALMNNFVHKFLKPRLLVLGSSTGNVLTAKACILHEKHFHLFEYDKDV